MLWFLGILGGLVLSAISFVGGRVFSQSELILSEKRRVYENFLINCPVPNDAYRSENDMERLKRENGFHDSYQVILLYAAPNVLIAINIYLEKFSEADALISNKTQPLHPAFKAAAVAHNNIILEMKRDSFAWSAFGYHGKSRLPANAVELAKRKI